MNTATANRTNSRRSTGTKTTQGKSGSVLNAVKSALTGRTVLLPVDDGLAYRDHVKAYASEFKPVGVRESWLFQSLADYAWRLDRIVALEMSMYAVGHYQFSSKSDTHATYLQYQAHLAYEKQLRNLHLQEARLRRHRAKDLAELKELQQARRVEDKAQQEVAIQRYFAAQSQAESANPAASGFEFATAQSKTSSAAHHPADSSPRPKLSRYDRSKNLAA